MPNTFFLSLGSNKGHRLHHLQKAHDLLFRNNIHINQSSIVLETKALLPPNAPSDWDQPFLNQVIEVTTYFTPIELLNIIKKIEHQIGRPHNYERWSPRIIDIDILISKEYLVYNQNHLTLPHPELHQRPFLLHLLTLLNPYQIAHLPNTPYHGLTFQEIGHRFIQLPGLFERSFILNPKFLGVVNITPDSHAHQGKHFDTQTAINQAIHLQKTGASIIDLGAQSTRVGATVLSEKDEWARLQPVLESLDTISRNNDDLHISIDTFYDEIAIKALAYPCVKYINNVKGLFQKQTLAMIAQKKSYYIAMHSFQIPPTLQDIGPYDQDPINALLIWSEKTVNELVNNGFSTDQILLDPGIGFNTCVYQTLKILQFINKLKKIGVKILVGHAHKNFMTTFTPKPRPEREIETLAISAYLVEQGIEYLRIYDTEIHHKFFTAQKCMQFT